MTLCEAEAIRAMITANLASFHNVGFGGKLDAITVFSTFGTTCPQRSVFVTSDFHRNAMPRISAQKLTKQINSDPEVDHISD